MTRAPEVGDWPAADFERHGQEVLALIRQHFEQIRTTPVTVPSTSAGLMASLRAPIPEDGQDFTDILADTQREILPYLVHWNHPSFHGYFSISASFPGILAETLTAALNVNAMLWKSGPAASALEQVVLEWIAQLVGYPQDADGVLVNGASLATLYALTAARDHAFGDSVRAHGIVGRDMPTPRVYTSDQAHSSVDKAAITLGFGLDNVVRIPADSRYRMVAADLDAAIRRDLAAGVRPVAVVATVGTTSTGAADPITEIHEVCARHGVWLHVDAAFGGFWRMAPSLAADAEDLAPADSIVVNPHKCLYVPKEASALYCRRRGDLANTFRLVPEYLTSDHDADTVDFMDRSPQLGRSFRALKIWWVIRSYGRAGLAARLEHSVQLAAWLRRAAAAHPDWREVAGSPFPLVCLRYVPRELEVEPKVSAEARRARINKINARILQIVNDSGTAFISHTVLEDGYAIRVSIGNIHTGTGDIDRLWEHLNDAAQKAKAEPL
jgi:aromatic-L-amino-acid decarboxylase